jgi:DNA end-binding protein Ku
MWKGAISFGLVTIPVKLYAATEEKELHFKQLHKQCGTPIRYKKFCPTCAVEVEADQIIKGYEIEKEQYVTITEEELEAIPVAASRTLEIVDFIQLSEIDPVFYDRTYYLEPGDGGSKPYALLRRAMEETGRIALAKVVMRSKESLAAIRVFREGVLALETMHFPDEVRSPAGLKGIVEPELRPQELDMAKNLVLSLSAPFDPAKYQNEYRDAVLQLIAAKAHGAVSAPAAVEPKPGRVVDLMDALRASIEAAAAERGGEPPAVAPVTTSSDLGIPTIIVPGMTPPGPNAVPPSAPEVAAVPPVPAAPPATRPTAGAAAAPATPPAAPLTLPPGFGVERGVVRDTGGRRPAPFSQRPVRPGAPSGGHSPAELNSHGPRRVPPGQSVWQYRPEL